LTDKNQSIDLHRLFILFSVVLTSDLDGGAVAC